jgi:hypothetical protein
MKYRKKPIVIEAIKFEFTADGIVTLREFCGSALGKIQRHRYDGDVAKAEIGTLEDGVHLTVKHIATEGDYIIRGIQGEFYPCKPDIFLATYDEILDIDPIDLIYQDIL